MNSSRQKICLVSYLFSTGALQAQFIPVESTGLPYHIIVSQVFIDSAAAPAGTQIGIFDSILCVGADTVEYAGQENIDIVTWEGSANPTCRDLRRGIPSARNYLRIFTAQS